MDWSQVAAASAGGVLIGIAASALLLVNGRIAGISGIVGGLLRLERGDLGWRVAFVLGLVYGGALMMLVDPTVVGSDLVRSPGAVVLAGLLVGIGVRLGNGCTSGHGVCGLSRLSVRSLAATGTFMGSGAVVAAVVTWVFGGTV